MNQLLKQRLVGVTVLVILGIIFLPMVLDKPESITSAPDVTNIKLAPYKEKKPIKTIPSEVISRYDESKSKQSQKDLPSSQKHVEAIKETIKKPQKHTKKFEKPPVKADGKPRWVVQMGSFSSKENASLLMKKLKLKKYPAYFEDLENNGKVIYRVRVGAFDSKLKAEKMKQKLDKEEKLKTLIVTLH